MYTVKVPRAAGSAGPQLSTCGAEPEIEHRPGIDWESIDQVTPDRESAGKGKGVDLRGRRPVPKKLTAILNPIASPAFTDVASAVLTMWIAAALQGMVALLESDPWWVVVTLAVLW